MFNKSIDNLGPIYKGSCIYILRGDIIRDIKANYSELEQLLSFHYEEVKGEEFYRYIFLNNQNQGELSGDYSKPNAVYLYKDSKDEGIDRQYYNFKIDDIEKLTEIRIERNKRNYQKQKDHLE